MARAWIKWLRGEGNRATTSPPNSDHSQDIQESEAVEQLGSVSEPWTDESNFDDRADENERDRNERESIVYSDALVDAQSEIEINVAIDDAPLDNSTENSVDGSETQSIIMDNSFDKDSLAVEIDSSSLL